MAWPTFPVLGSRYVSAFREDFNDVIDSLVKVFAGGSEPSIKYALMLWADTSELKLKQRNVANTAWIALGDLETDYLGALPLSGTGGGAMTGPIDMGGFGITNLPAGSGSAPARVADLGAYVKADGTIAFTNLPTFPAANPTVATQGAHKGYVDGKVLAGGTYTGQITMTVAPSAIQHVIRKTDLDSTIDAHTHSGGAGSGPKVPGANISSPAGSGGYLLQSNGSLGAAFVAVTCDYFYQGDEEVLVGNVSSSDSWQEVDVSAFVPTTAHALLIVPITAVTGYRYNWYLNFRKTGLSVTTGFPHRGYIAVSNGFISYPTVVPINAARKFDIKAIRIDGSGTLNLYMHGYFKSPA